MALKPQTMNFRRESDQEIYRAIFHRYLVRGVTGLSEEDRQRLQKAEWATAAVSGVNFRAQGVATGPAGGYLAPKDFSNQIEESLKHYSAVRQIATVITTSKGTDLPWPTVDDTSEIGELLDENTPATEQDVTFGQVVFTAYKYSSKIVRVSRELIEDSAIDLEAVLTSLFARRIGTLQNQHFTTGTGTGQPTGVLTTASLGKQGIPGQTTTVIYNDLIDLLHSVDPLYRTAVLSGKTKIIENIHIGWMMHDSTLQYIRELKDPQGNQAVPPTPETSRNILLGYPVIINPDMPVMAAGAASILFGDFSRYLIRDALQMAVIRLSERYAEYGQVGFIAFMRSDGHTLDAGTDPIKYYQNSAT